MFIADVVPIKRIPRGIPQTLSYFTPQRIEPGVLVTAKIRNTKTPAIIIACEDAKSRKIEIKKSSFELKPISGIITEHPLLTKKQLDLAVWTSNYYIEPLSFIFKSFTPSVPKKIKESPAKKAAKIARGNFIKTKPLLIKSDSLLDSLKEIESRIKTALDNEQQILILAPEINIGDQAAEILKNNPDFQNILDLTKKSAKVPAWKNYNEVKSGKSEIIIGTRKSAFLPFCNLGLIIILQENSSSHKQWEGHPLYDARDIAEKLAEIFNANLILESQTPSAVSFHKAQSGIFDIQDIGNKEKTFYAKIIDMKEEQNRKNYSLFSESLSNNLSKTIKEKGRAILFVNRKGGANFIVCKSCGAVSKCPNCDIPMIYYPLKKSFRETQIQNRLICNHCQYTASPPKICSKCRGVEIKYLGLGTQKIEELLKQKFPALNILRFDSDIATTDADKKNILTQFEEKKPSVLIATQQIVNAAKLPDISFVGIISFDSMIAIPDFRSPERIFSILQQLAEKCKNILIQTYNPENQTIKSLVKLDYAQFIKKELEDREALFYPPFSKIIKLKYKNPELAQSQKESERLAAFLRRKLNNLIVKKELKISGPVPAFIFKEKGIYNWHIIIKTKNTIDNGKEDAIKRYLEKAIPQAWEIDVNPESLL